MLSFLMSLSLGFSAIDLNQLPVQRVQEIAQEVVSHLETDLVSRPTILVTERAETTPLGAISYQSGKCVMIINRNKNAWAQWGRFLNSQNESQWNDIIAASVAHEMGHCFKEGRQYVADTSQGEFTRGLANIQGLDTQHQIVFKQELFADTVALLYAKEHFGDRADAVIESLVNSREKFSGDDPSHDTGAPLRHLLNKPMGRQNAERLGAAAQRVLKGMDLVQIQMAHAH